MRREGLCALLALAFLCIAAAWYPLEAVRVAGPESVGREARAPWLFLGLQELLRHMPAWVGGLLIPGAAFFLLAALPWLSGRTEGMGKPEPDWRRPGPLDWLGWYVLAAGAGLTLAGYLRP